MQREMWTDLPRITEVDPKPKRSDCEPRAVTSSLPVESQCSSPSSQNGWMDYPRFGRHVRGRLV